jgi:hypothetical protein
MGRARAIAQNRTRTPTESRMCVFFLLRILSAVELEIRSRTHITALALGGTYPNNEQICDPVRVSFSRFVRNRNA